MAAVERQSEGKAQDRRDAARRRRETGPGKVDFGNMRFVDVRLNPMEAGIYDAQPLSVEEVLGGIQQLSFDGYKVSISYDGKNSCFIASISCALLDRANTGLVLVTRGKDVVDVLGLSLYKHYTVLNEIWESDGSKRAAPDRG